MGLFAQLRQIRDARADPAAAIAVEIDRVMELIGAPVAAVLGPLGAGGGTAATIENIVGGYAGSGLSRRDEARLTGGVVDRRKGAFGYLVADPKGGVTLHQAIVRRSRQIELGGPLFRWEPGDVTVHLTARTATVEVVLSAADVPEMRFELVTALGPGRTMVDHFAAVVGVAVQ